MSKVKVKKSFTLIELIIVIILISASYYLIFSNSNFKIKDDSKMISIISIKSYLIENFDFEEELALVCIEEDLSCYVKIDGKIKKDVKIENLFKTKPDVYTYNRNEEIIEYQSININDINQDIIFEFKIDTDYKSKDFVLDTLANKVYLFNSIFPRAKVYNSLSEVFETFNTNQIEVQDAF